MAERSLLIVPDSNRRSAKRFEMDWAVVIQGKSRNGMSFDEQGNLANLSSHGALVHLGRDLPVGAKLNIWILVPTQQELWMHFSARVLRLEALAGGVGVALKFNSVRPKFSPSIMRMQN